MICSTPTTSSIPNQPFHNWSRRINFTANQSFRPTLRGEIVEIIRSAEEENRRVKWTGSRWSFMPSFVSEEIIIESEGISGEVNIGINTDPNHIDNKLLHHLNLTDEALTLFSNGSLVHIKGGTKIYNVNRILHGLVPSTNGGGIDFDESDLNCFSNSKAMPTLGGSGGQAIAGAISTGTHGGDIRLPPIADNVVAIHLIGPGGQEWWIEKSNGITIGTEEDTRRELERIATTLPERESEICRHILVRKDDDFFNSVLVSVGRMGFIYSLVIQALDSFKLVENRRDKVWEGLQDDLSSTRFNSFLIERGDSIGFELHHLQVIINPFINSGGLHDCKVAERHIVPCNARNLNMSESSSGFDIQSFVCKLQDVRILLVFLIPILAGLVAAVAGLLALAGVLSAIPFIGWALATASFAAAAAMAVVITALTGLIGYLTVSGSLTSGELIASISNFAYTFGMRSLMKIALTTLFNSAYPIISKLGVSWKIMDTYNYNGEDFCQKVDSMDFAFDVSDTRDGGYLAFIQEVLTIFDELYNRNVAVAGLLTLRYSSNTNSKIGISRFPVTCHIEVPILQNFQGNTEFLERVQRVAIRFNGIPSWGQLMNIYDSNNIRDIYGSDLITWRRTLTELIRRGAGRDFTFSNDFTARYNLEPWGDDVITSIRLSITVGNDHLGDTAWPHRQNVSEAFAFVRLRDSSLVEISLNEGSTWFANTEHERIVDLPVGTMWGDIISVGIRHVAAGPDWGADNWTMNHIVISSTSTTSEVRERFNISGIPVWQFRKNDNRIWEHSF